MLSLVSSPRETGYFGASFRVTEVLMAIPQLAAASAFPIFVRAARDDPERLAYGVGRMFHAMAVLGVGIALALALGAAFVIEVIAGPEFAPAAGVMRIQAVTLLVVFLVVTFNYALLSLREHRTMLVVTGGALVINAVGAALLGAAHGADGAALATMVADVAGLLATGWALWSARAARRPVAHAAPARRACCRARGRSCGSLPVADVAKAAIGTRRLRRDAAATAGNPRGAAGSRPERLRRRMT